PFAGTQAVASRQIGCLWSNRRQPVSPHRARLSRRAGGGDAVADPSHPALCWHPSRCFSPARVRGWRPGRGLGAVGDPRPTKLARVAVVAPAHAGEPTARQASAPELGTATTKTAHRYLE